MSLSTFRAWTWQVGYQTASEIALAMGVSLAQVELWVKQCQKGTYTGGDYHD